MLDSSCESLHSSTLSQYTGKGLGFNGLSEG